MANCVDKGKDGLKNCKETRIERREWCEKWEDKGQNACEDWDQNCCDWWPCSWACEVLTWVCVAWTWISNVVCVLAAELENVVCVAWNAIAYMACVVVDTIVAIVAAIVDILEAVLGWFLNVLAWFWDLILSIPIIGRLIKTIWNAVLTVIWGLVSIVDAVGYLVGIRPEKRLRVCTILLCDENSNEEGVAKRSQIVAELNKAIEIYKQAHVRIIPSRPLQFRSGFGKTEVADDSWITTFCPQGGNNKSVLEVGCGAEGLLKDLWNVGPQLQFILNTNCAFGNYRRMIGYGAPVAVYVVRDAGGEDSGGCAAPNWDYVLVEVAPVSGFDIPNQPARTIAHELGHACNLFHIDLEHNLMKKGEGSKLWTNVETWQQILIRMSRHVTFL